MFKGQFCLQDDVEEALGKGRAGAGQKGRQAKGPAKQATDGDHGAAPQLQQV